MARHARSESGAKSPTKAQVAFEEYRQRMDEGFQKHVAGSQTMSSDSGMGAFPVYSIPVPSGGESSGPGAGGSPVPAPADGTTLIDSLATLLDLSVRTVNSTLGGWLNVMDRFYGGPYHHISHAEDSCECECEHDRGHECDCQHDCHCHDGHHACQHEHSEPWDQCHTGVHNCC